MQRHRQGPTRRRGDSPFGPNGVRVDDQYSRWRDHGDPDELWFTWFPAIIHNFNVGPTELSEVLSWEEFCILALNAKSINDANEKTIRDAESARRKR